MPGGNHRSEEGARSYLVGSVDNALHLLALLRDYPSLAVKEAAEMLGVAPSTAHRLLTTLQARGFVSQESTTRRYGPGPALLEVALASLRRVDVRRVARPHLTALAAETRATTSLAVAEGATVRFVDSVEGPDLVRVRSTTGDVAPTHLTVVGKAMLSSAPEAEVLRLYPAPHLPGPDADAAVSRDALLSELGEIRTAGYASAVGEFGAGLGVVAVPIIDLDGHALAGIAVSVPASDFDAERRRALAAAVSRRARRIEEELRR